MLVVNGEDEEEQQQKAEEEEAAAPAAAAAAAAGGKGACSVRPWATLSATLPENKYAPPPGLHKPI